jgi:hypothetical protein
VASNELRQLRTAFTVIGHDFNDTGRRLIGHGRFKNGTIGTSDKLPIVVESEVIVGQAFPVDRDLDQIAVLPVEGRADTLKDVDMDIVGGEAPP